MTERDSNILAVACIAREGKIFIARRAATKKLFPGRFELVGGHVEIGEQPEAALVREVQEEIGVTVQVVEPIHAFTEQVGDVFYIEVVYLCTLAPGQEPTISPAEHSESYWIGRGEIDKFDKEDQETVALRKAFAKIGD